MDWTLPSQRKASRRRWLETLLYGAESTLFLGAGARRGRRDWSPRHQHGSCAQSTGTARGTEAQSEGNLSEGKMSLEKKELCPNFGQSQNVEFTSMFSKNDPRIG
jgi:hypothetical protein